MPAVDDLPKMVSLSPEPLVTAGEKSMMAMKLTDPFQPTPRHNLDAEVIEALFQQDIDLGLTRHDFDPVRSPLEEVEPVIPNKSARLDDEWLPSKVDESSEEDSLDKIWAGLDYTIDNETGEYMLVPSVSSAGPSDPAESPASAPAPPSVGPRGSPDGGASPPAETMLCGPIPTTIDDLIGATGPSQPQELARRPQHTPGDPAQRSLPDSDSEIALLDRMIEATGHSHSDCGPAQPRAPLTRMMSLEQRWQDLASVLLLPPGQDSLPLPPPPPPLPPPPPQQRRPPPIGAHSGIQSGGFLLETGAVGQPGLSPPHLTLPPGHPPPLGNPGAPGGDLTYFQLSPVAAPPAVAPPLPAAMAPPALDQDDAFLSQLLGVDQLDLSGMPITDLAPQTWSSGGQTVGGGSPTQSPPGDHGPPSQSGLPGLGGAGRPSSAPSGPGSGAARSPRLPVAQKKHLMYGKRFFQGHDGAYDDSSRSSSEPGVSPARPGCSPPQRYGAEGGLRAAYPPPGQAATGADTPEVKFSCTPQFTGMTPVEPLDPVSHNHSYHQPRPAEGVTDPSKPLARDKAIDKKPAERIPRDEKRLRSLEIPLSAEEIVHMPMDDFNECLAKLQLSEAQLSLVRDVRRRGKNKLAAQNCRKRKLDQITTLTEDLLKVRDQRQRMLAEHQMLTEERSRIREKYAQLHRHVFQSLRDADNRPYSQSEYSLQLSADGDVLLVPRGAARGAAVVPPAVTPAGRQKLPPPASQ